ncbi:MAG: hypothetical protein RIA63_12660 [Cyclobacteriaceae bacterium]
MTAPIFFSCSTAKEEQSKIADWVNQKIDLKHIRNERDSFIMLNAAGEKVGGMIWEKNISDNRYVHNDISYFDDGSVYEEASFHFSLDPLAMDSVQIDMQTSAANATVNFKIDHKKVTGPLVITRGTNERVIPVDSLFEFDVVRPEIYSLIHSLDFTNVTEIPMKVFSPEGLAVAEAKITNMGKETLDAGYGKYECIKLNLDGGGVIPDNVIWINESPKRIVKVYVPGPELDIVLVKVVPLE